MTTMHDGFRSFIRLRARRAGWVAGALLASAWLFALPAHAAATCAEAGGQCVDAVDCANMNGVGARDSALCPDEDAPICCRAGASAAAPSAVLTDEQCEERCLIKVNSCVLTTLSSTPEARVEACKNVLCYAFSEIRGEDFKRCFEQISCTILAGDDEWEGVANCLDGGAVPGSAEDTEAPKPGKPIKLPDPLGGRNLAQIIGQAIRAFTGIAGAIALLMFVYGGVYWIYSKGEGEKVTRAIEIIRNAVIGLVLIFGAYFFTSAIVQGILHAPTAETPTEEQTP